MPSRKIELHDTSIEAIIEVGSQTVVVLRAYLHQSEGKAGWDPGTGWIQAAALTFDEAEIDEDWPTLPADIGDGDLSIGEEAWESLIPLPFEPASDVTLKVSLTSGQHLTIKGARAVLTLIGEPTYVEEFAGASA